MAKRRAQEEEEEEKEENNALRFFQSHGFVLVPSFLMQRELQALQQESAALYAHVQAVSADASQRIVEQGCVMDIMADCPIPEASRTRVDQALYLSARAAQFALASGKIEPESEQNDVIARLLFERLPSYAAELLASSSAVDLPSCCRNNDELLFFNEHYVVKPSQTAVEFRWHRDDDEQLGMCLHRASIPPYISAWCALDDITPENGALRFVPLPVQEALGPLHSSCEDDSCSSSFRDEPALNAAATAPLLAQAGSVVFFLSNVWHCSSANDSDSARRAFYAQYSRSKITAVPNDPAPLSFAIPCDVSSNGERRRRSKRAREMQASSPEETSATESSRGPD